MIGTNPRLEVPVVTLSNGIKMPMVGLGTFHEVANERHVIVDAVKTALEFGYRNIDTAWSYGTEPYVGQGIRESKVAREEIIVTTKLWNTFHRPEDVRPAFEESLKNLGLDYIDLYLLHFPCAWDPANDPATPTPTVVDIDYLDTWRAMEDLLTTGKVKALGVSNFDRFQLERLLTHCRHPPQVLQTEIHPEWPENDLVDYCKRHHIHVVASTPMGSFMSNLHQSPHIKKVAEKYHISTGAAMLSWGVHRGTTVIPKSSNPQRIKDNIRDIIQLDQGDMDEINAVSNGKNKHRYWDMETIWNIKIHSHKEE